MFPKPEIIKKSMRRKYGSASASPLNASNQQTLAVNHRDVIRRQGKAGLNTSSGESSTVEFSSTTTAEDKEMVNAIMYAMVNKMNEKIQTLEAKLARLEDTQDQMGTDGTDEDD